MVSSLGKPTAQPRDTLMEFPQGQEGQKQHLLPSAPRQNHMAGEVPRTAASPLPVLHNTCPGGASATSLLETSHLQAEASVSHWTFIQHTANNMTVLHHL